MTKSKKETPVEKPVETQEYATKEDLNKLTDVIVELTKAVNDLRNKDTITIDTREFPGTADMSKVKESTTNTNTFIGSGAVKSTAAPEQESIMAKVEEVGPEKMPIPPDWRKMVDDLLGRDFGIDVVYPQSGSGFLFKIIVPAEKSNASQSHKEFYKVDIRTKAISYSDGIEGIRKFCELVKKNLSQKQ